MKRYVPFIEQEKSKIAEPVDCIITAAGLSSRMGKWKMMLPWQEGTILDASIKNALSFCSRIILVAGHRADELFERYNNQPNITLVFNSNYQHGLFSSIKSAAHAVNSDYCFITHGDMPCLNAALFKEIWLQRGLYALIPRVNRTPGHPILLPRQYLNDAVKTEGCKSMRQALLAGPYRYLEMTTDEIITDIDTPADLNRLLGK